MATTKITSPELFDLGSLNTALKLPSGTTAERPTSPSTGEWRYNTTTNLVEFWDGGAWRDLQSENIPPINSEHFNVVLYNGTSATHAITGVGFKPDLVWIKDRGNAESHIWNDSTRGAGNDLSSNSINAQANRPTGFVSFDSDGFTLGADSGGVVNDSSRGPYVAWCWKAGGGTTSSNTDGTITSTVQVNSKAGFSIVNYQGAGGSSSTVGHGLSAAPEMMIIKSTSNAGTSYTWGVYHTGIGPTKYLELNYNNAAATASTPWNNTAPTSTIFNLGSWSAVNGSGVDYIAYCFHSVAGYSSFGTYTGTGSAGNAQNLGFEPAFVLIKRTDSAGAWSLYDNKRSPSNPRDKKLVPNSDAAENNAGTTYQLNFLTNGFEFLGGGSDLNANGGNFIYIAFGSDASAAPALPDSFANALYAGNNTSQSITGLGFKPDLTWIKSRDNTRDHNLTDSVRGVTHPIYMTTGAQLTNSTFLTSFDTDGFSLGNQAAANQLGEDFVAWNWKANSIPTINTDGTIQSVVSANQAAGFSIVTYTGNLVAGASIGHGLGVKPSFIITKSTSNTESWEVWSSVLNSGGVGLQLRLNSSVAAFSAADYYSTPDTSKFYVGPYTGCNGNGYSYVSYCFTSISGFSDFGSYTGNGSAGYAITGLGFQPSFIMIKGITSADNWFIFDSARGGSVALNPNLTAAEYADAGVTSFDSDGFTLGSDAGGNRNGDTYIYMAFKENPTPYPLAGNMSFLVIAGGGSGGARDAGPGGAGGLRTSYGSSSGGGSSAESDITLAAGTYTITIGAGGAKVVEVTIITPGNQGFNSSLSGTGMTTVTSLGGGKGGDGAGTSPGTGGSGGGGTAGQSGGSGTSGQGFAGATGTGGYTSGGGGGAGATGNTPPSNENGGAGGAGLSVSITGSSTAYAGGGGGSGDTSGGAGGTGGGGAGQSNPSLDATSGTANTGGGGGSHRQNLGTSGAGGSGVVVLRLLTSEYSSSTTGSPTVTTDGDYSVLTYTGSGTYVHS